MADGVVLFATATTFPVLCNGAMRVDGSTSADRVLDLADEWFADRDRGWSLITSDLGADADADLVAAATARGLLAVGASPAMVCEAPLDPASLPDGIEARWLHEDGSVTVRSTRARLAPRSSAASSRERSNLRRRAAMISVAMVRMKESWPSTTRPRPGRRKSRSL